MSKTEILVFSAVLAGLIFIAVCSPDQEKRKAERKCANFCEVFGSEVQAFDFEQKECRCSK